MEGLELQLFINRSCIFRIDLHAAFAAPDEDENTDSRINLSRYPKEDEK